MTCGIMMLVGGLAFCLFGGVVVVIAVANMAKNAKSRTWPSVQGKVLSSCAEEHKWTSQGGAYDHSSFNVVITYEYYIGAKRFRSDQAAIQAGRSYYTREDAELQVARSPVGSAIQVYYDRADPKESTLSRTFSFKPVFGVLFGLAFVVLGVIALFSSAEQFRR